MPTSAVLSLQNKPLTVDAELDTRLALRSAKSSMVYERTGTAICNVSYYQTSTGSIIKRQELTCVLDRRNARVIRQLRGREFFVGPLVRT